MVTHRLPRNEPIIIDRSRCLHCGTQLTIRDLVPIVSWLIEGGRCRFCNRKIGKTYLFFEAMSVVIAITCFSMLAADAAVFGMLLGWVLLSLSVIDWRHMILPDVITIPFILLGVVAAYYLNTENIVAHFLGAVFGFLTLWGLATIYRNLRGFDGLGFGDVKMFAGAGAWVSIWGLPPVMLIAASSALFFVAIQKIFFGIQSRRFDRLPFGPFLALGLWIVWLYINAPYTDRISYWCIEYTCS